MAMHSRLAILTTCQLCPDKAKQLIPMPSTTACLSNACDLLHLTSNLHHQRLKVQQEAAACCATGPTLFFPFLCTFWVTQNDTCLKQCAMGLPICSFVAESLVSSIPWCAGKKPEEDELMASVAAGLTEEELEELRNAY